MTLSFEQVRSSPRVSVAQIGARMHYAVPILLHRAGLLEALYTDLCAEAGWVRAVRRIIPERILPDSAKRLFGRRVPEVPRSRINCFSAFGVSRILQRNRVHTSAQMIEHLMRANASFAKLVARSGLKRSDVVYTFNGASLEILRAAKARSIKTVLEQISAPIAHDQRLLTDERNRWPGWESDTNPSGWQSMADREGEEWQLADTIVCGSQYVVDAIRSEGGPAHKCVVVPYGVASQVASPKPSSNRLTVLCVATLQLRKGVQYLIELAELLRDKPIEIRVVGPSQLTTKALGRLRQAVTVVGEVSRQGMREEYAKADLFVLPTLSEGSATVCYEALASGLPVISTPNAGSVIREGVDGFVVPIRDARTIASHIETLLRHRERLEQMKRNALATAQNYNLESYGRRLVDLITRN